MAKWKRPVPEGLAEKLVKAGMAFTAAKTARDAAIVEALMAGASTRHVAAAVGMSATQVQAIGNRNGWPTAAMKAEWEAERQRNREWRADLADAIAKFIETGEKIDPTAT